MLNLDPNALVDGVFAIWCGKGPGVDRSSDMFKHGNIAGCSKQGGVLLIVGDDHACKSPSPPHQSEHAFIAAMIPVLNPSGVREFIEFDRQDWHAPVAKLSIVTTGKSYLDVRETLALMGISDDVAKALGLRLLKIGVIWPLEPQCIVEFAQGLEEILVVEEKRQVIEYQIKEHLYNEAHRPRVVGKHDEAGEWVKVPSSGIFLPPNGELTPGAIAHVIADQVCAAEKCRRRKQKKKLIDPPKRALN